MRKACGMIFLTILFVSGFFSIAAFAADIETPSIPYTQTAGPPAEEEPDPLMELWGKYYSDLYAAHDDFPIAQGSYFLGKLTSDGYNPIIDISSIDYNLNSLSITPYGEDIINADWDGTRWNATVGGSEFTFTKDNDNHSVSVPFGDMSNTIRVVGGADIVLPDLYSTRIDDVSDTAPYGVEIWETGRRDSMSSNDSDGFVRATFKDLLLNSTAVQLGISSYDYKPDGKNKSVTTEEYNDRFITDYGSDCYYDVLPPHATNLFEIHKVVCTLLQSQDKSKTTGVEVGANLKTISINYYQPDGTDTGTSMGLPLIEVIMDIKTGTYVFMYQLNNQYFYIRNSAWVDKTIDLSPRINSTVMDVIKAVNERGIELTVNEVYQFRSGWLTGKPIDIPIKLETESETYFNKRDLKIAGTVYKDGEFYNRINFEVDPAGCEGDIMHVNNPVNCKYYALPDLPLPGLYTINLSAEYNGDDVPVFTRMGRDFRGPDLEIQITEGSEPTPEEIARDYPIVGELYMHPAVSVPAVPGLDCVEGYDCQETVQMVESGADSTVMTGILNKYKYPYVKGDEVKRITFTKTGCVDEAIMVVQNDPNQAYSTIPSGSYKTICTYTSELFRLEPALFPDSYMLTAEATHGSDVVGKNYYEVRVEPKQILEKNLVTVREAISDLNIAGIDRTTITDVGDKTLYNIEVTTDAKLLGVIDVQLPVTVQVDAQTAEVGKTDYAFWGFLTTHGDIQDKSVQAAK